MDVTLFVFIGLAFAAAMSGAIFKPGAWYEALEKPWWCPPKWAFPTVWSVLYVLIAVSGWLAYEAAAPEQRPLAMGLYGLQLVLNAGWSAVFFGMKRMWLGLAELSLLWLSIAVLIAAFLAIDTTAGLLLVPYLVWVSIAGYLNWSMIRLNPEAARGEGAVAQLARRS